ncbi:MAG TPA: PTS system mannose/fructose/sorbose family transporter subunit IID [Gemmatimonadales bacterium]|nr:PTS system mannose/fructose/sorbose family transporter subunit IID [Gemmatimonadales bacterium]
MRGRGRALLRLLAVQGAWNYERMTGIGMGYAAEPMLEDLQATSPARHLEATVRSAEFFNCHPYLAGLALGASVRAEHEGVPGAQIQRLRTALCSPLGALGDQVFWAGLVPIVICLALVTIALGGGGLTLVAAVLSYNVIRMVVTRWALVTGLGAGMQVGTAISASWLPRAAARIAAPAGFAAGAAVPLVAAWLLAPATMPWIMAAVASAVAALALFRWGGARWTSPRVALLFAVVAFLWTRVVP